ncbi:hypothetical protein Clacol_008907 [Clathrus columnatus]|uniref:chitinase n=1 Tax=Clathrus columnatus TaxID=1419009 RepID=A0AAV5AJ17_9AGAM|nr:hypothetical protein Clacol_008907 [Clathrus columnatus]
MKFSLRHTIFSASVVAALATLSSFTSATAIPTSVAKRDGSAPRFVIYSDLSVSGGALPDASAFKGYNVVNLAFLLSSGPADQAAAWSSLSESDRSSIKSSYNAAGIKLMVSAFGSTDTPTSSGTDPTQLAQTMATFVKNNGLDGIDIDYEDFNAISAGTAVNWLSTFTKALRDNLPAGQYTISHAPVAPWFSPSLGAPYLEVDKQVGSLIDFYNVQFYNQGSAYTTCSGLFDSSSEFPGSSVQEIAQAGVPLDKIVMGKPAEAADTSTGFVDTQTLAQCVSQGKGQGWNGGVMVWQYPHADSSWIETVRGSAWPV